jgi:vitamin B12 transporter
LAAAAMFPVGALARNYTELEDVLVTGTFSQQSQITSTISVLNSPEIRALNKRTVAGLLKTMPGLLVEEGGGPGGLSVVSIRGAESNFTLVLLDGVPVSDPTNSRGGGYDFANLSTALVERIEVVRGAQSAIYGSDALAGVINIITRRSEEGHTQQVYAEWGEDDYTDLNFNARGIFTELQYAVEIASRDEGEPVAGSTRQFDRANVSLAWQLTDTLGVSALYNHLDGFRGN